MYSYFIANRNAALESLSVATGCMEEKLMISLSEAAMKEALIVTI